MTDKPYPFNADQLAWLHDLETTEEPQTKEYLHVERGFDGLPAGFCCLGRACVTLGLLPSSGSKFVSYEGKGATLPESAVAKLHLLDEEGELGWTAEIDGERFNSLVVMNDKGKSFKEIAAYIRANPWNVFRDPEDAA